MSHVHSEFARPSQRLIDRSLTLCKTLLSLQSNFYPFAAICENGKIDCLFGDDLGVENPSELKVLEQLQWRIIDNVTNNKAYAALVYPAEIELNDSDSQDAIVITLSEPNKQERSVVYPFYRANQRLIISPPLVEK